MLLVLLQFLDLLMLLVLLQMQESAHVSTNARVACGHIAARVASRVVLLVLKQLIVLLELILLQVFAARADTAASPACY